MAPDKKFVLITGCTPGGIGHALALEFQRYGCHIIATARSTEVIESLAKQGMSTVALDVTKPKSIAECKDEVTAITGGRLDILVNNAGRTHVIPALDMDLEDVRLTYETNVFGPMSMCQAFAPLLIEARGLIVNISSTSSVVPYLFGGIYSSTKGAINTYSLALRMELEPFGVRVMVAMTGTVRSNITSHFDRELPSNSIYKPVEDVFLRRLKFSQTTATMPTEVYAKKVVAQAMKGEGWLGGWIGRSPDWYWAGGMANLVWLTTFLPRWMGEKAVGTFQLLRLGWIAGPIRAARAKRD
ncbi:Fc.00g115040.m01.CDS01 [Cosmosporella sp. VM-42]